MHTPSSSPSPSLSGVPSAQEKDSSTDSTSVPKTQQSGPSAQDTQKSISPAQNQSLPSTQSPVSQQTVGDVTTGEPLTEKVQILESYHFYSRRVFGLEMICVIRAMHAQLSFLH